MATAHAGNRTSAGRRKALRAALAALASVAASLTDPARRPGKRHPPYRDSLAPTPCGTEIGVRLFRRGQHDLLLVGGTDAIEEAPDPAEGRGHEVALLELEVAPDAERRPVLHGAS